MAPIASEMRKLHAICEEYAREYSISFNALESKCLVALPENCRITFKKVNDCIFYNDGRMSDLFQSFCHLGHLITPDSYDGEDIKCTEVYLKCRSKRFLSLTKTVVPEVIH